MGNVTEFERVASLLTNTLSFEQDINVSVFETNIRGSEFFTLIFIPLDCTPQQQWIIQQAAYIHNQF